MVGPGELTLRHAAEVEILLHLQARGLHHVNVNTAVSASPQQRPNVGLPASSPAPLVRKRLKQNFSAFSPRKDTVCTAVRTMLASLFTRYLSRLGTNVLCSETSLSLSGKVTIPAQYSCTITVTLYCHSHPTNYHISPIILHSPYTTIVTLLSLPLGPSV